MVAVANIVAVPVTDTAYGYIATSEGVSTEGVARDVTDTERIVRDYFSDIPVMIQIARCESHFRHSLADGSVLVGSIDPADTGVMQINSRFHAKEARTRGLDLTNLYDNLAYARMLYEKEGTTPWSASAQCWERTIAMR